MNKSFESFGEACSPMVSLSSLQDLFMVKESQQMHSIGNTWEALADSSGYLVSEGIIKFPSNEQRRSYKYPQDLQLVEYKI